MRTLLSNLFLAVLVAFFFASCSRNGGLLESPSPSSSSATLVGLLDGLPAAGTTFPLPANFCPAVSGLMVAHINDRIIQMRENENFNKMQVNATSVAASYSPNPNMTGSTDTFYSCRLGFGLSNPSSVGSYSFYVLLPAFSPETADSGTYYFDSGSVDSIFAVGTNRRWAIDPFDREGFLFCGSRLQTWTTTAWGGHGSGVGFQGIATKNVQKPKYFNIECYHRTELDSDYVEYKLRVHFAGGEGTWVSGNDSISIEQGVFEGVLTVLSTDWFRRQGYIKSRKRSLSKKVLPYTQMEFGKVNKDGTSTIKIVDVDEKLRRSLAKKRR